MLVGQVNQLHLLRLISFLLFVFTLLVLLLMLLHYLCHTYAMHTVNAPISFPSMFQTHTQVHEHTTYVCLYNVHIWLFSLSTINLDTLFIYTHELNLTVGFSLRSLLYRLVCGTAKYNQNKIPNRKID